MRGELPEWLNGTVSKTVVSLRVPRVRIPDSPPVYLPPLELMPLWMFIHACEFGI